MKSNHHPVLGSLSSTGYCIFPSYNMNIQIEKPFNRMNPS